MDLLFAHMNVIILFAYLNVPSIVSGFGYGLISGAFSIINVLADMLGPGTIGIHGDSQYFFVVTGNYNNTIFIEQTGLSVMKRKSTDYIIAYD